MIEQLIGAIIKLRDEHLKKKKVLVERVKEAETQLSQVRGESRQLDRQWESVRPRTPEGKYVCPDCDITSMVFVSREPTNPNPPIIVPPGLYRCELCGNMGYYNLSGYRVCG